MRKPMRSGVHQLDLTIFSITLPSCCAGALSGKGKIPYAILALLDVIRHYPGQVSTLTSTLFALLALSHQHGLAIICHCKLSLDGMFPFACFF